MLHTIMLLAPTPSPSPAPSPDKGATLLEHTMSPTAVAVLLLLALVIDYMSVGPNSIRDRLAFLLAVPAIREGFDGSPLDQWTVQTASSFIEQLLDATGGAYVAGASINAILGALVGMLFIYVIGCMLPVKASKKLGRFATLTFPQSPLYRLNTRLWIAAVLLGLMADLPGGTVGDVTRGCVDFLTGLVAPLPAWLFGAA
ncbi:hypothetical protein [Micromonospora sp. CB01531]|uniref:hypothetical protein n=1 Tax=Micromonospora sp. CB01531 TaxID=1718947 RepID=UPI000B17544C|nr:hypothetical protein [Micromonospora sp. CB01531]